jgi:hypothetical protein
LVVADCNDQPEKTGLVCGYEIPRRGFGSAIRVRVIAADDRPFRSAERTHQPELLGGIDLERLVVARKIPARMQHRNLEVIAVAPSFDQAAALFRKRRARLFLELRTMIGA